MLLSELPMLTVVLKIMSTFIRKIGFQYDTASNGLIALEKYRNFNQRYVFVLMGKPRIHSQTPLLPWLVH